METQETQVSPKSRLAVALIAVLMGPVGVHRFYIGKVNTGIGMLALSFGGLAFFWLLPLNIVAWTVLGIWVLVDLVTILRGHMTDSDGLPITRW